MDGNSPATTRLREKGGLMNAQGITFALLGAPGGNSELELSQDGGHYFLQLTSHEAHGGFRVLIGPTEAVGLAAVHPTGVGGWGTRLARAS
jgi:hypothetical protein